MGPKCAAAEPTTATAREQLTLGIQMDDVHQPPLLQESGMAHGTQMDNV